MKNKFATEKYVDSVVAPIEDRVTIVEAKPVLTATLCNGNPIPVNAKLAQCSEIIAATGLSVYDEGVVKSTVVKSLNFVGSVVDAVYNETTSRADITIADIVTIPAVVSVADVAVVDLTNPAGDVNSSAWTVYVTTSVAPSTGWYSVMVEMDGLYMAGEVGPLKTPIQILGTVDQSKSSTLYSERLQGLVANVYDVLEPNQCLVPYTCQETALRLYNANDVVSMFIKVQISSNLYPIPKFTAENVRVTLKKLHTVAAYTPPAGGA